MVIEVTFPNPMVHHNLLYCCFSGDYIPVYEKPIQMPALLTIQFKLEGFSPKLPNTMMKKNLGFMV